MFSEASVLYEMADEGLYPFDESLHERAMRYEREKKEGVTALPYDKWCADVWEPLHRKIN